MVQVTAQSRPIVLSPGEKVCASSQLQPGGRGVRFLIQRNGVIGPAFAVRHNDSVVAYLNRCAHKLVELDWREGEFFDSEQQYLVCATHGALYDPASGACVSGPCRGATLTVIPVHEADGSVWLTKVSATVVK